MELIFSLWVIVSCNFVLLKLLPGSPLDPDLISDINIIQKLESQHKLNLSLYEQYIDYLNSLLHADLGYSIVQDQSVAKIIQHTMGNSLTLGSLCFIFILFIALPLGVLASIPNNHRVDYFLDKFCVFSLSFPSVILAPILVYLFAIKFELLPAGFLLSWKHYILPIVCLSLRPIGFLASLIRDKMLEVQSKDYIKTAKAKGLSLNKIIWKHALKNSISSSLSVLGSMFAGLLSGSLVIEVIFEIPGMGREFIQAVLARDYSLALGLGLVYSFMLISFNLFCDLFQSHLDKRFLMEKAK